MNKVYLAIYGYFDDVQILGAFMTSVTAEFVCEEDARKRGDMFEGWRDGDGGSGGFGGKTIRSAVSYFVEEFEVKP